MTANAAIQAVIDKIEALAPTATPEQIAYLAKAAEAVAGQGTVQEVVAAGTDAVADIAGAVTTGVTTVNAAANTGATSINAAVSACTTAIQAALATPHTQPISSITSLQATLDDKIAAGWHTVWLPAHALTAAPTGGAQFVSAEFGSDKVFDGGYAFDANVAEYVWFKIRAPKKMIVGDGMYFSVSWRHGAGATAYGVAFGLQILAVGSGEAIGGALGTEQVVTGTGGTADVGYATARSASPVIPSGGPTSSDMLYLRLARKPAHASDTLTVDAVVSGVTLLYHTAGGDDF